MLTPNFSRLLGTLARGEDLTRTLTLICEMIEAYKAKQRAMATVVMLDASTGELRTGAAPNLPERFSDAINALGIGPAAGTAGSAIYRRETIVVADIANDSLWKDHRDLALDFSLHASWAVPIFDSSNSILGALVLYFPKPRRAAAHTLDEISELALIAGLAIERHQAEAERAGRAQTLGTMVENLN